MFKNVYLLVNVFHLLKITCTLLRLIRIMCPCACVRVSERQHSYMGSDDSFQSQLTASPTWVLELNSAHQAWQQAPLPTEPTQGPHSVI